MTEIIVNASSNYKVHIGKGLLSDCGKTIGGLLSPCKVLVVTDTNVAPLYLQTVTNSLSADGFTPISYTIPAGEDSKNPETLFKLWDFVAENGISKSDIMLSLGGGAVGDLTGFAAGTYMRGIGCVHMPTSLLSACDSSVGGKTAVNLQAGKNLAGVFSQPLSVIVDTDTLQTLPLCRLQDGAAECIKYGVLGNKALLSLFESQFTDEAKFILDNAEQIIVESIKMKADYVNRDEFDSGDRRFLNLGHTLGHAIEKMSNYEISHGYAVSIGISLITKLGEHIGITEIGTSTRLDNILMHFGLPTESPYQSSELKEYILNDKKIFKNEITLVIPEKIDSCVLKAFDINHFISIITELI